MLIQPSGAYVIQSSFIGFVWGFFPLLPVKQIKPNKENNLAEALHGYVFLKKSDFPYGCKKSYVVTSHYRVALVLSMLGSVEYNYIFCSSENMVVGLFCFPLSFLLFIPLCLWLSI